MDSIVRTSDSTVTLCQRTRWPTTAPLGGALEVHTMCHTEAHKIGKAEHTPTAHREHAEYPLVNTQG